MKRSNILEDHNSREKSWTAQVSPHATYSNLNKN